MPALEDAVLRVSKAVECGICKGVLNQPRRTRCNHVYCRFCITKHLELSKNRCYCPLCKTEVTKRGLTDCPTLQAIVEKMKDAVTAIRHDTEGALSPSIFCASPGDRAESLPSARKENKARRQLLAQRSGDQSPLTKRAKTADRDAPTAEPTGSTSNQQHQHQHQHQQQQQRRPERLQVYADSHHSAEDTEEHASSGDQRATGSAGAGKNRSSDGTEGQGVSNSRGNPADNTKLNRGSALLLRLDSVPRVDMEHGERVGGSQVHADRQPVRPSDTDTRYTAHRSGSRIGQGGHGGVGSDGDDADDDDDDGDDDRAGEMGMDGSVDEVAGSQAYADTVDLLFDAPDSSELPSALDISFTPPPQRDEKAAQQQAVKQENKKREHDQWEQGRSRKKGQEDTEGHGETGENVKEVKTKGCAEQKQKGQPQPPAPATPYATASDSSNANHHGDDDENDEVRGAVPLQRIASEEAYEAQTLVVDGDDDEGGSADGEGDGESRDTPAGTRAHTQPKDRGEASPKLTTTTTSAATASSSSGGSSSSSVTSTASAVGGTHDPAKPPPHQQPPVTSDPNASTTATGGGLSKEAPRPPQRPLQGCTLLMTGVPRDVEDRVRTAALQLGAEVLSRFEEEVTHVLASLDASRLLVSNTLKVMMGIACGKWIVSPEWLYACESSCSHVAEDEYEMQGLAGANGEEDQSGNGARNDGGDNSRASGARCARIAQAPLLSGFTVAFAGQFESVDIRSEFERLARLAGCRLVSVDEAIQQSLARPDTTVILVDSERVEDEVLDSLASVPTETVRDFYWLVDSVTAYKPHSPANYILDEDTMLEM